MDRVRMLTSVWMRKRGKRVVCVAGLLLLAVFAVISCGGSVGTAPTTTGTNAAAGSGSGGNAVQVLMKNFAFDPTTVTIKVGESITWTNEDSAPHTVAADHGEFSSDQFSAGGTFTFKFDKAGTYPYHCSIHPNMTGTVVVQ